MKTLIGSLVEWDICMGRTVLATRQGHVVAQDGQHLIVKSTTRLEKITTPYRACSVGECRIVRTPGYLMRLSIGLMCWLLKRSR